MFRLLNSNVNVFYLMSWCLELYLLQHYMKSTLHLHSNKRGYLDFIIYFNNHNMTIISELGLAFSWFLVQAQTALTQNFLFQVYNSKKRINAYNGIIEYVSCAIMLLSNVCGWYIQTNKEWFQFISLPMLSNEIGIILYRLLDVNPSGLRDFGGKSRRHFQLVKNRWNILIF